MAVIDATNLIITTFDENRDFLRVILKIPASGNQVRFRTSTPRTVGMVSKVSGTFGTATIFSCGTNFTTLLASSGVDFTAAQKITLVGPCTHFEFKGGTSDVDVVLEIILV